MKKSSITPKRKILAIGLINLLSIASLATATFAWFNVFKKVTEDPFQLTSGESSVVIDTFAYAAPINKDGDDNPIPLAYSEHTTSGIVNSNVSVGETDAEGVAAISFASSDLSPFSFLPLYEDEESLDASSFPRFIFEFRYIKTNFYGFVKCLISSLSLTNTSESGYTSISSFLTYDYRYYTTSNSENPLHTNGFGSALSESAYSSTQWNALTFTNNTAADFSLYNSSTESGGDLFGATLNSTKTPSKQCYIPAMSETYGTGSNKKNYYSKSTIFEIRVNPISLFRYFLSHPRANQAPINFSLSFSARLDYSNSPYYEATT